MHLSGDGFRPTFRFGNLLGGCAKAGGSLGLMITGVKGRSYDANCEMLDLGSATGGRGGVRRHRADQLVSAFWYCRVDRPGRLAGYSLTWRNTTDFSDIRRQLRCCVS